MRRSLWVALLFLFPSLILTLLLNAALSLQRGLAFPGVWIGIFVIPVVMTTAAVRPAFVRGFYSLAALSFAFWLVVHLRLWTDAGRAVLEREGLVALSTWAVAFGAVAGLAGFLLSRRTVAQ